MARNRAAGSRQHRTNIQAAGSRSICGASRAIPGCGFTLAEVVGIEGSRGAYTAILKLRPRYVNEKCTACGDCAAAVSSEIANPYTYGLDRIKAAHLPHAMAYPQRYVLDPSLIGTADADRASAACKVGAIDLTMQEQTVELAVGAVVWATGWNPYDAARIQPYGYGRFPNVITSLEFERLAEPGGPTGGKLLRHSDGKVVRPMSRFISPRSTASRAPSSTCRCSIIRN